MVGVTPLVLVVNTDKVAAGALQRLGADADRLARRPGGDVDGRRRHIVATCADRQLRALGVSTSERAFFAPEMAPIRDVVPGFDVKRWHGMMAPAGTPPAIVAKLSDEIHAFLRLPATEAKLRERGVVRVGSSAKEFAQAMRPKAAACSAPRSPGFARTPDALHRDPASRAGRPLLRTSASVAPMRPSGGSMKRA